MSSSTPYFPLPIFRSVYHLRVVLLVKVFGAEGRVNERTVSRSLIAALCEQSDLWMTFDQSGAVKADKVVSFVAGKKCQNCTNVLNVVGSVEKRRSSSSRCSFKYAGFSDVTPAVTFPQT